MKDNSLNLFFGRLPLDDFLDDLETVKSLEEKEAIELINRIIEWYSKGVEDEEWEKWLESFEDKEKKKIGGVIKALLFIFKEFVSGNINKSELREDFEILKLPQNYLDHFIKKLKPFEKEFRKKALEGKKPYENVLVSIDWTIDNKIYRDRKEKSVSSVELVYSSSGERKVVQFNLNLKALRHLIYRLNKIEEELCEYKKH